MSTSVSIAGTQTLPTSANTQTPHSPITPRLRHAHVATSSPGAGPSRSPRIQTRSSQAPPSPVTATTRRRSSTAKQHVEAKEEKPAGPSFLQPSEFFPLNNGAGGKYVTPWRPAGQEEQWLSPEDDPDAKRGIPIFRPTMEDFKDFEGYVTRTVPWGQYSGIAKIIPPAEWTGELPAISKEAMSDIRIKSPIQQTMLGRSGLFRVTNVEKRRLKPFDIKEWFEKCQNKTFAGPGPKEVDRALDRGSKGANERLVKAQEDMKRQKAERRAKLEAAKKRKEERMSLGGSVRVDTSGAGEVDHQTVEDEEAEINNQASDPTAEDLPALGHSPRSSADSDPLAQTPESSSNAIDPFYDTFDPKTAWLPKDTQAEDYTAEACSGMEKKFWKSLITREPSWYGADLQGSLFADKSTPWNVSCLPNLLNRCSLTKKLPGVNSPYLYFGMYGATFAWHVEDMDLFSINYIHFGAPKFWYAVPQRHADRFEHTLAGYFPQDAQRCDQFLRHKSFAMSPTQLANDKIPVNMLVHNQGEYVITYPRGYHAGFNMGFNCAESINFALDSWLDLGRRAKVCECVEHSVRINVDEMLAEEELIEAIEEERMVGKSRKRKAVVGDDEKTSTPKARKVRVVHHDEETGEKMEVELPETTLPVNGLETKKRKIRIAKEKEPKPVIIREVISYPCLFCPSLSTEDLRPVYEPTDAVKAYSQSVTKNDGITAHHSCALGIPEVGIQNIEVDGVPVLHIVDTDRIETARWKLKCARCEDKKLRASGAKVQCTKKSCIKAYHISCATDDPRIQYTVHEVLEWPAPPADGTEPVAPVEPTKTIKIELLCENHNPAQIAIRKAQGVEDLKQKILALPVDSQIKVKSKGGGFLHGSLMRVLEPSSQVEVRLETGQKYLVPFDRIEFKDTKPKLQENEYARTYTTKAKESIPSRSIPIPATPTKEVAPRPSTHVVSRAKAHPPNGQYPTQAGPSRVIANNPRPIAYGPPPLGPPPGPVYHPHAHPHAQHYAPSPYMMNPRIPTRVVSGHQPPPHMHHAPHPQAWPPRPQYLPRPAYPAYNIGPGHPHLHPRSMSSNSHPPHVNAHGHPPPHLRATSAGSHSHVNGHAQQSQSRSSSSSNAHPAMSVAHLTNPGPPGHEQRPSQGPSGGRSDKIDLTLGHMRKLMSHLPPLHIPAIHLAGTNGKGSVSAIIDSILRVASLRTARYNSPHLIEPRDAIRLDGVPPTREVYNSAVATVQRIAEERKIEVSPFELATATAYYIFTTAQPAIDVMIIECGMGGVNDATNVIPPECNLTSALTSVGLDHTTFLGDSIAAITDQKARITVPGGLLITAPNLASDALRTVHGIGYQLRAAVIESHPSTVVEEPRRPFSLVPFVPPQPTLVRTRVPVIENGVMVPGEDYVVTRLSLGGAHQLDNLSLAITIIHIISQDRRALSIQPALARITQPVIQRGVELTRWEGRCSWLQYQISSDRSVPVLVDGAHNADSAKTLRAYIDDLALPDRIKVHFVISLSASPGKSPESVLRPLIRQEDKVTLVDFTTPVEGMPWVKPASKEEVKGVVSTLTSSVGIVDQPGVEGLKSILGSVGESDLVVVCGSLYLVADAYRLASSTTA